MQAKHQLKNKLNKHVTLHAGVLEDHVEVWGPMCMTLRLAREDVYSNMRETDLYDASEVKVYTDMLLTARRAAAEAVAQKKVTRAAVPALIAEQFILVLQEWLTEEQFAELVEKTRLCNEEGICHSHDYCDANMAMDQALEEMGIEALPDLEEGMSDEVNELWNKSWDLAKASIALRGTTSRR